MTSTPVIVATRITDLSTDVVNGENFRGSRRAHRRSVQDPLCGNRSYVYERGNVSNHSNLTMSYYGK